MEHLPDRTVSVSLRFKTTPVFMRIETMSECSDKKLIKPPVAIIGPGTVGTALGVLAHRAGWNIAAVGGRTGSKTKITAEKISPETKRCEPVQAGKAGELVFLTVSDDAIR